MRILVVEDVATDAGLIRKMLESGLPAARLEVAVCLKDASGALRSGTLDVILLDLSLPDGEGSFAVETIHAAAPEVPIVVLTGSEQIMDVGALQLGAEDYLTKDRLDGATLVRSIRYAIERKKVELALLNSERRLRERELELAHMARLRVLGEMASGLAHELNQPLTSIANLASATLNRVDSVHFSRTRLIENLTGIAEESLRAGEIIRRMRHLAKNGAPQRQRLSVNRSVREIAALLKHELDHNRIELRLDLDPRDPEVWADEVQTDQILINLARNAIEAMTQAECHDRTLLFRTRQGDRRVEVRVEDSGPGIDEGALETVFEPFHTTKADGLGLGLAICRTILRAHDSSLEAGRSWLGGASFQFVIPSVACDSAEPERHLQKMDR